MPRSLPAWRRPAPIVIDVAIVAAILVLGIVQGPGDLPVTAASRAFTVALTLPLLVRRRWPVPVLALLAVIATVQWALDVRAFGDAALLVALFTVAHMTPARTALAAWGIIEVGALLAVLRWAPGEEVRSFVGLSGLAIAAAVTGQNLRSRRALVASLEERARRLEHERDQQGRLAAAAERARIARELHDIVAHNVSVMIALSDGASYALREDPEEAGTAMRTVSRTGRQALTEMRRLLGVLHTEGDEAELAPQPGLPQISELVADVRRAGLEVDYQARGGTDAELPAGLQLAAYRIVQEALTNTLKHAGAGASAKVRIVHGPDGLEVDVVDDGRASGAVGGPGGAGLRGMQERAAIYGGRVEAGPRPTGGWRVRLRVPLDRPVAAPA